ncbi:phosphoribosylanthranilate isomerase [Candidatus Vidania fulgoroideorum]
MFLRTRIKFCGIRRRKEVINCIRLGVDYIGFIFYKRSFRYISPTIVRSITNGICSDSCIPYKVGVFVNPSYNYIRDCVLKSGIDIIQVYFKVGNPDFSRICSNYKLIHCIGINDNISNSVSIINKSNDIFLIENISPRYGGTGISFNWDIISSLKRRNIIVSGGLNYINVRHLISKYNLYAVDVSSGIEFNRKKSFKLMRKFCLSVKSSNQL